MTRRVELRYLDGWVYLWQVSGYLCGSLWGCTAEEWLSGPWGWD